MEGQRGKALLRSGLLDATGVLIAGGAPAERGDAHAGALGAEDLMGREVERELRRLGASVHLLPDISAEDPCAAGVADVLEREGPVQVLVNDCAATFAVGLRAHADGMLALRDCLDGAWNATRAVANEFIPSGRGGRVINLAPQSRDGPHAGREAARCALENMARTLSIEWSRYGIRTTTILPGPRTTAVEVAGLVAYLSSAAGEYYSGCAFELGGPAG